MQLDIQRESTDFFPTTFKRWFYIFEDRVYMKISRVKIPRP